MGGWPPPAGNPGGGIGDPVPVQGAGPFRDPFCGSGTIPIEAALIAKNRAPGLNRSFAAQKWDIIPAQILDGRGGGGPGQGVSRLLRHLGRGSGPQAVEIARSNAVKAEVEDMVRFEVANALTFHAQGKYGRLVTNPPYGERLLEKRQAGELYRQFGQVLDRCP